MARMPPRSLPRVWRRVSAMASSRSIFPRLLLGNIERELAIADTRRQTLGKLRGGILAIGLHEFGKCREQAGLGEAIAINPIEPSLGPGFSDISDCRTLMLAVPPRVRCRSCLSSHGLCVAGRTAVRGPEEVTLPWFAAEAANKFKLG